MRIAVASEDRSKATALFNTISQAHIPAYFQESVNINNASEYLLTNDYDKAISSANKCLNSTDVNIVTGALVIKGFALLRKDSLGDELNGIISKLLGSDDLNSKTVAYELKAQIELETTSMVSVELYQEVERLKETIEKAGDKLSGENSKYLLYRLALLTLWRKPFDASTLASFRRFDVPPPMLAQFHYLTILVKDKLTKRLNEEQALAFIYRGSANNLSRLTDEEKARIKREVRLTLDKIYQN